MQISDRDISTLGFSTYIAGRLYQEGIYTVGQLTALSEDDLLKFRIIGPRIVQKIRITLKSNGLYLTGEQPVGKSLEPDISILHLSPRVYNGLKRAGIHTVEQLEGKTESELAPIKWLGKTAFEEIKAALEAYRAGRPAPGQVRLKCCGCGKILTGEDEVWRFQRPDVQYGWVDVPCCSRKCAEDACQEYDERLVAILEKLRGQQPEQMTAVEFWGGRDGSR